MILQGVSIKSARYEALSTRRDESIFVENL